MTKPHRDRSPSDPLAVGLTLYNDAAAGSLGRARGTSALPDSVPPGNAKTGRPRKPETEQVESRATVRRSRGADDARPANWSPWIAPSQWRYRPRPSRHAPVKVQEGGPWLVVFAAPSSR